MIDYGTRQTDLAVRRAEWRLSRVYRQAQRDIDEKLKSTPVRRFGENEDVASAVLFLTSERASFITGAVLDVNGGAWVG